MRVIITAMTTIVTTMMRIPPPTDPPMIAAVGIGDDASEYEQKNIMHQATGATLIIYIMRTQSPL